MCSENTAVRALADRDSALTGFRVLDLADAKGAFCGKLLADLGAEVIKIEKPQGDETSRVGPFKGDSLDPEESLYFINFNSNKKGITLDLECSQGLDSFKRLVENADVVIESFQPGVMKTLGLDYLALREINPGIVVVSITGFGQSGPYKDYKAPASVCFAMGGVMNLCGDPDKPPLVAPYEQTYQLACIYAAYAILLALYNRLAIGVGQHVGVSIYEVQSSQHHIIVNYSCNQYISERQGAHSLLAGIFPHGPYRCKDGYVFFFIQAPWHWKGLYEWMGSPEALRDPIWENRHFRCQNADVIAPYIKDFALKYSKAELFEEGQARHLPIVPVNTPADFVNDHHIKAHAFFLELEHPRVGRYKCPGFPYKLSETPSRIRYPAPLLGQHNEEILGRSLKHPKKELTIPGFAATFDAGKLPLENIRVIELGFAIAGPAVGMYLADYGAEVLHVESSVHPDHARGRVLSDPRRKLQQNVIFADLNRNKKGITLNLQTEKGRELLRRLVRISDVIIENFSPRVMRRWKLHYSHLKEVKPDIIVANLAAFGHTGPYDEYLGVATTNNAFSGLYHVWKYPGAFEPACPHSFLPDYAAAAYGALAIMAALHYRAKTGKGQRIEVAQIEAVASLLGPLYLDYLVNNRIQEPLGNRSSYTAPHGCYRCRGYDRWCVIAVYTEEDWQLFCSALGDPVWTRDAKFLDMASRLENIEELDRHVEEWTMKQTPYQVMRTLQKAGVAAGVVQNAEDLTYDIQLRESNFIIEIDHPETGRQEYPGLIAKLSGTPGKICSWPSLGEHNQYVFGELLGMSGREIASLVDEGVLV